MQTFLILSENREFIEKEVARFKKDLQVSPYDIREISPDTSIHIDSVRQLIKESIVSPFNSPNQLIIIRDIYKATIEAQNALLKFLEESIPSITIILTSPHEKNVLPTVISRSQIIKEKRGFPKNQQEIQVFKKTFLNLLTEKNSSKLKFVQDKIATRDDAYLFIKNLTDFLEGELINPSGKIKLSPFQIAKLLKKVSAAHKYLDYNVNFKLVLDVLLLGFP